MSSGPVKPRIAILEDHEDTREMLRIALESDFSIREFPTASELLSVLEEEKFSAIIADIMLPGLDGYAFVRTIREDPRFRELCVIAMTALATAGDRERALSAGFNEYLVKPVVPERIAATLWRYVNAESRWNPSSS